MDMNALEGHFRQFFQNIKRPNYWLYINKISGINIDRPAAHILLMLAYPSKEQIYRLHDIAHQLGVAPPSITRKCQDLESAGYINKLTDSNDKRSIGLQLTPKGKIAARKIKKAQIETLAAALLGWDKGDKNRFIELFDKFVNDFEKLLTNGEK